jgi:hypothetical protein
MRFLFQHTERVTSRQMPQRPGVPGHPSSWLYSWLVTCSPQVTLLPASSSSHIARWLMQQSGDDHVNAPVVCTAWFTRRLTWSYCVTSVSTAASAPSDSSVASA